MTSKKWAYIGEWFQEACIPFSRTAIAPKLSTNNPHGNQGGPHIPWSPGMIETIHTYTSRSLNLIHRFLRYESNITSINGLPGYGRQGQSWYGTMWRWPIRWEKTTSACYTTPARAHEQEERRCSTHWWDSPSTPGTREGTSVEWQLARKLGRLSQTLPTHKPAARTALSPCPTPRRAGTACSPWTPPEPPVCRSSETRNSTAGTRKSIKTPGRPGPPMAPNRRRRTRWWMPPTEAQSHGVTPSLPPSPLCRQLALCTSPHVSPCPPSESEDPRLTLPQTSSKLEFLLSHLEIALKDEIEANHFNFLHRISKSLCLRSSNSTPETGGGWVLLHKLESFSSALLMVHPQSWNWSNLPLLQ